MLIRFLFGCLLGFGGVARFCWAKDGLLPAYEKEVQPVLKSLCFECHGPTKAEGGVRFDRLDPDLVNGPHAETWHDALDQLNLGEMPPRKAKQPTPHQRRLLTGWIQAALREAAEAKRLQNGRVVTRRLTRYEYANTMRDLLSLDLDFARDLPPEPASPEGFLNNGATLEMSPTQIEIYLKAARNALAEAIVTGQRPQMYQCSQTETATGKLPTKRIAGHEPVRPEFILDLREFPRHGQFELKITAQAAVPSGQGLPKIRVSIGHVPGIIHVPRGLIGEADVSEKPQTFTFRGRMEDFPQPGPIAFGNSGFKGMIVMIDFLDADGNELRYRDRKYAQPQGRAKKKKSNAKKQPEPAAQPKPLPFGDRLDIVVTAVEFKAPVVESWPPPSHRRLLFDSENSGDEPRYVRELLQHFMELAYRRPVSKEEIERTANLFETIRQQTDSFEEAVRETFASVLVSPHFLYIVENRAPNADSQRVTEFELASRLSYFLWSSKPDEQLFDLAGKASLHEPELLEHEVRRMLADERSSEFIRRFVDQWLDLDALDRVAVNPEYFPDFENDLKEHMRQETQACFAEILHNDRSALELLDCDWTMLNRPLAKHYGIDGPRSSKFERVMLKPGSRRGGLLGQGAFLLANSNGEDSHPIKRAVWILDRLLDSPPAPPPPDVPELDAESPDLAKLTLKEQLAVHREKESCANCHRGIDPWGIPLENFDAVGRWRTKVSAHRKRRETAVDAVSILPNGQKINGMQQLRRYLVEERSQWFARSVVKRLMAYALGRSLDRGDREAVDALTNEFVKNDFRLASLIIDFVRSEAFQTK